MDTNRTSVIMMGASGAVGGHALQALLNHQDIKKITILGRTPIPNLKAGELEVNQHKIDIFNVNSYRSFVSGHRVAICTLGVGEPSKMSREEFVKIDKTAVLDFAKACKKGGVQHFELLSSIGVSASSSSFFLRTKGELIEELKELNFEHLSIFQPSMILTPTNRYGLTQAIVLKVWPKLNPLLFGSMHKYRGVPVDILGRAMALNIFQNKTGEEYLDWDDFYAIVKE